MDSLRVVRVDPRSLGDGPSGNRLVGLKRTFDEVKSSLDQCTSSIECQSPQDFVLSELKRNSCVPDQLEFLEITEEMIAAYTMEVTRAVRSQNLPELKLLHRNGSKLQCCNRFGESIMHMACRRGHVEIVKFMLQEANVSLLVRDDYKRTPLHDAFWTPKPNFELVKLLVSHVPELLCVKDVRGHTPLDYVRKEDWERWLDFFQKNKHLLRPDVTRGAAKAA